eukprot:scaffold38389_cov70-Phaeocystis_antarctica.AAC.5
MLPIASSDESEWRMSWRERPREYCTQSSTCTLNAAASTSAGPHGCPAASHWALSSSAARPECVRAAESQASLPWEAQGTARLLAARVDDPVGDVALPELEAPEQPVDHLGDLQAYHVGHIGLDDEGELAVHVVKLVAQRVERAGQQHGLIAVDGWLHRALALERAHVARVSRAAEHACRAAVTEERIGQRNRDLRVLLIPHTSSATCPGLASAHCPVVRSPLMPVWQPIPTMSARCTKHDSLRCSARCADRPGERKPVVVHTHK